MMLLLLAALVGLFLSATGIYGVVSYVARQRTAEVGVRLALGADPGAVRTLIWSRGMRLAALGVVLGLAGAIVLSSVLGSLLFEVSPLDMPTLLAASVVLLTVAAVSSAVPAARAARTLPVVALRADA